MTALGNFLQNRRLPPSFRLQDEDEQLREESKGIHEEFVTLPTDEETIFKAVRLNDINRISQLVRSGTDVNTVHEGGACLVKCPSLYRDIQMKKYCPLHVAVLHSNLQTIKTLCSLGADLNQIDGNNRSPVHLASLSARLDVLNLLCDKGVNVNTQTTSMRTPLIEAVCLNRRHLVERLIAAGADLDLEDIKGSTALSYALMMPGVDVFIVDILLKAGCDVNRSNSHGATPLMFAVSLKKVDKIQALLNAGADVNALDQQHRSAFHIATNDGQGVFVAKMLLRNGAHPDIPDKTGRTPLDYAVSQGKLRVLQLLLLADCERDYSLFKSPLVQEICNKVPVFRDWLNSEMYNPRSLRRVCRGNIRKSLSLKGLNNIDQLPLPTTLKDFLLVKYFE